MARVSRKVATGLLAKKGKKLAAVAKKHADDARVKRIVERMLNDSPLNAMVNASILDEDDFIRAAFNIPASMEPTEQQRERYRRANEQRMRGMQSRMDLEDEVSQRLNISLVDHHISVLTSKTAKATAKQLAAVELRHLMAQRRSNIQRIELLPAVDNYVMNDAELDEIIREFGGE